MATEFFKIINKIDTNKIMKINLLKFLILLFTGVFLFQNLYSQVSEKDSSYHPFHVNYWVTIPIVVVGGIANFWAIPRSTNKPLLTVPEISGLNRSVINSFDKWALNQDPSNRDYLTNLSDNLLGVITATPALLLFDKTIRGDWFDMLLMYAETMTITNNIYENSFIGPTFQQRFRPVTYYESMPMAKRIAGENRNSFYSGHTASATAATFFMAKVFSDYHPEIGAYKYLLYAAASIPPFIEGYIRIKALYHFPSDVIVGYAIGALCGIVVPEFHRIQDKNITFGIYSSVYSTGLAMQWQPDFLK